MHVADWIVLIATLLIIISYGLYKSRHEKNVEGYFLGSRNMPWWLIMLGIMGTQASAITFLSAPGQAYTDGMRFIQNYFGLPLAMVIICIFFVPIFHKMRVVTAYEYLERRFDLKTRTLTSFLFLLGRGLSTGISIYAPSIIISSLLGWNIYLTNILMGGLLIIYTVSGGTRAITYTQQLQFCIIMGGMFLAGYTVVKLLPENVGFFDALRTGGSFGRMNVITSGNKSDGSFDWNDKYNIWSGLLGGFFLSLSYFGTDQSQVSRYLTAPTMRESRLGLILNGFLKVPMQFGILLVGVLVFAFYQHSQAPVFFNETVVAQARQTSFAPKLDSLNAVYQQLQIDNASLASENFAAQKQNQDKQKEVRNQFKQTLKEAVPAGETDDTNYVFLYFVLHHLPTGMVGLLIAVIILAAWGSIAAALNSLASSSLVDIHQKIFNKNATGEHLYKLGWQYTLGWGLFCIAVAMFATDMGSLIEAVNILGSLFYGVILGIFLVAFFIKYVRGHAVFWAAVAGEAVVITVYNMKIVSFLWLNVIGALALIVFALILQLFFSRKNNSLPSYTDNA